MVDLSIAMLNYQRVYICVCVCPPSAVHPLAEYALVYGVPISMHGGSPIARWMVYFMEHPNIKCMIWGYSHDLGSLHNLVLVMWILDDFGVTSGVVC